MCYITDIFTCKNILTDLARWRKCQALLKFKRQERKTLAEAEEEEFSDEVESSGST